MDNWLSFSGEALDGYAVICSFIGNRHGDLDIGEVWAGDVRDQGYERMFHGMQPWWYIGVYHHQLFERRIRC